ncbi:hypothetical protein Leryth_014969 [Lithospermum erythrorhizon]|nr:hypothetical protein Leryth_014969 [Lithospermum erythrorhizon]
MGFFTYTVAGAGIILVGAFESLISASESPENHPDPPLSPPQSPPTTTTTTRSPLFSSSVTYISICILSVLFMLDSLMSIVDAMKTNDHMGSVIQFEVILIALVFLLYSVFGLIDVIKKDGVFKLNGSIMNMVCLFGFGEEFWLFYQQRKDPSGVENRYYDLLLVPVGVCLFSTMLELKNPGYRYARFGRGIGLILQGMWVVQMGFSFFSDLMSNGCYLSQKSRGNYTVKCRGHMEYHRGRAIATLLFNCHLAFIVVLISGVYSLACKKNVSVREAVRYRPLGAEMQQFVGQGQFTLDSDDEGGYDANVGIKEVRNGEMQETVLIVPESRVNGHGSHQ